MSDSVVDHLKAHPDVVGARDKLLLALLYLLDSIRVTVVTPKRNVPIESIFELAISNQVIAALFARGGRLVHQIIHPLTPVCLVIAADELEVSESLLPDVLSNGFFQGFLNGKLGLQRGDLLL